MESDQEILRKVIRMTIAYAGKKFAPDVLIEPALERAKELITEYKKKPDMDIWRNGRLDLYIRHLVQNFIFDPGNREDYELSDENFEAVDALIEAEDMLGDKVSDAELMECFDYTAEELARLRIIAKYLNGIDREKAYQEFSKKYGL